ncbi:VIT1/CCC1 transporter family protein [Mucilaginibacter sp. McL0603]|uniref:VIT1/CCC1 transporter family protein n=1 Tax=Mucilaginibacter sp. McL0603 TaxID=3415670 RepID=UPI003CF961EE
MHHEHHLKSSDTIRDIVIGMSDGLTVPFALAAGLSGAITSSNIVVTAGIAEIVAGSIAMGLGGFLAGKTESDHYASELKREYDEVERVPEEEKFEVKEVFAGFGLSKQLQNEIAEEMAKDKDKWVDFMMRYELGLEKPEANRASQSAITIGLSYIIGGIIPLSPYFFIKDSQQALYYSCAITSVCLFVFGYFKSKVTGQPAFTGALKVLIIGALAAAAAFGMAKLINGGKL